MQILNGINKLNRLLVIVFFPTLLFSVFPQTASAQGLRCTDIIATSLTPNSISFYIDQVARESTNVPQPKFMNPQYELDISAHWQGTQNVPRAVRDTLLSQTAIIDFPLLAADTGTIKMSAPGNFASMRLRHQWNGLNMSTNIGLPIDAVITRSLHGGNTLVPETARAVIIFMHGGGTKTTGHHIAAAFSNFMSQYGVVVLSLDAPFHAYGPRETALQPLEYYKYLRDFRHTFIPAGVPTFIGGHSMGGLHADNLMRLSDQADLGLHDAFHGLINLSGPLDNAPGLSRAEKSEAESKVLENEALMSLVPEGQRDLSVLLLTQGKASALSSLSAENFMSVVNWQKPEHNGSRYIPTLAVMGERDALYIGREHIYQEYVTDLSNTDVVLMGQRSDYKGQTDWVSHMLFDHYRPGTKDQPETFHVMKEFVEKRLNTKIEALDHALIPNYDGSKMGLVVRVVHEYYNNLAFRKFAEQYSHTFKHATPLMNDIGSRTSEISRELKAINTELKALSSNSAANNDKISTLNERRATLEAEFGVLRQKQQSIYIPEGPLESFAQSNVAQRLQVQTQINELIQERRQLAKDHLQTQARVDQLQKSMDSAIQSAVNNTATQPESVQLARRNFEAALDQMVDLQVQMNESNHELVEQNLTRGQVDVNPTPAHVSLYEKLDAAYANYNDLENQYRKSIEAAIAQGLYGDSAQELHSELHGSQQASTLNTANTVGLKEKLELLQNRINAIDSSLYLRQIEVNILMADYVNTITPELFTVETTTLTTELNKPLEELFGKTSKLEQFWRVWSSLWKERPADQGTSLY